MDCLKSGKPLDDRFYRSKIGQNRDRLLEEEGIKHVHLGRRNSNVIVYIVEYEEHISLLQIATHSHLETNPPGKNLKAVFGRHLSRLEAGLSVAVSKAKSSPGRIGRRIRKKRAKS